MPPDAAAGGRRRVVIVGAGFGGLAAALKLRHADVDVTIVDRMNHHLFQPLLYQVAAGGLAPSDCAAPIRPALKRSSNTTFLMSEVTDVDAEQRQVVLDRGDRLDYDSLIVACGAQTSYFGHDEWKDVSCGLKTLADAVDLRKRFYGAFEEAERSDDPAARAEWLTFVVIGGGPTGVEVAGQLAITADAMKRQYRRIDPGSARVILLDAGDRVVSAFSERLSGKVAEQLAELGVTVREGARATAIDARGVTIEIGGATERIDTRTVIWAAGVHAVPLTDALARATGASTDRGGRIEVNPDLTVPGHPEISVVGDVASLEGPAGKPLPGLATVAIQEAHHVAKGIAEGRPGASTPFRYFDKGALAVVGKGKAVCEIRGRELWGRPAFFTYLGVHLYYLGGQTGRRVEVLIRWVGARFGRAPERADRGRARERRAGVSGARRARSMSDAALPIALDTVDLARIQFAMTSIYHFLFVPLTLGLAPLVAVMQTLWHRKQDEQWLRLTRFFGTLLVINFAIGVATGLVQEFQFGMNWSVYSKFVGDVFGAPLAIEGLAAFALEATFLGLWIFGWERLSPRLHLATIWIVALGTWLSAYFILVANSWMQHPVGYRIADGRAELTDVWALLSHNFALHAFLHTILAGPVDRGAPDLRRRLLALSPPPQRRAVPRAAVLALIVAVPVTALQPRGRQPVRHRATDLQPMKISRRRGALGVRDSRVASRCSRSAASPGGPRPELRHRRYPTCSRSSRPPDRSRTRCRASIRSRRRYEQRYGPGNYIPPVRPLLLGHAGDGVPRHAHVPGRRAGRVPVSQRRKLETARWFHRVAIVTIAFPFVAMAAGWVLTEMGTTAVDRAGAAENGGRELAQRGQQRDLGQHQRVRAALHRPRDRRFRAHEALRARRPARGDGRSGDVSLPEFWFLLIAVVWGGLLPARGLRLRGGDPAPVPGA